MELQEQLLKQAAEKLGIDFSIILEAGKPRALRLNHQGKHRLVNNGERYDSMSLEAEQTIDNKQATKILLKEMGIPVPGGITFTSKTVSEAEQHLSALEPNTWVCKPLNSTEGMGVGMDIQSAEDLHQHLKEHEGQFDSWILEEQATGKDLRLQAIGGKMVAACRREPANVFGDGEKSVQELIDIRHQETQALNPENRCIADAETLELLAEQHLQLTDVPASGQQIWLKKVANMSQGGRAIDLTDEIHPLYHQWIEDIAKQLDIEIFSLDAITADHTADPLEHCKVLELNARPVWVHHTFSEGRQHDIPTMIVKSLFELV